MRWKRHHLQKGGAGRPQFTGRGVATLSEEETHVEKLERGFDIARQEGAIPEKAVVFFAKENGSASLSSTIATSTRSACFATRSGLGSVAILRGGDG